MEKILPSSPFPDIGFINERNRGYINEEAIHAINEAVTGVIVVIVGVIHIFI